MGKIRVELISWLAETVETQGAGHETTLEYEISEGETVGRVLDHFALKYPRFGKLVFDAKAHKIREDILTFVNEYNVMLAEGLKTRLKRGDVLTLAPMMEGG